MVDRFSSEARSRVMSRIKQRDTAPEMALRRALWAAGLRYRLKLNRQLPGKPDLVFAGVKVAIFVDGCFWHGCPQHGRLPKSHEAYWAPKLARNLRRDAEVNAALEVMGWKVVRLWEHQIRADLAGCVARVAALVRPCTSP